MGWREHTMNRLVHTGGVVTHCRCGLSFMEPFNAIFREATDVDVAMGRADDRWRDHRQQHECRVWIDVAPNRQRQCIHDPGHIGDHVTDTGAVLVPSDLCVNALCAKHYGGPEDWGCTGHSPYLNEKE